MKSAFLFCLLTVGLGGLAQNPTAVDLTCENAVNPLGVEDPNPSLSWKIRASQRSVRQTAYRILVADDSLALQAGKANFWDSQKTLSEQSIQVPYGGKALLPAKTYFWKVRVWDNRGKASAWSKPARWQTGLTSAEDWKGAKWIGYRQMPDSLYTVPAAHQKGPAKWQGVNDVLPLLRTTVNLAKPVKRATAFVCGLGHFELSANGKKIGDHFLDPGWTKYDREAQYVAFDLTQNLKPGKNVLGVMLGNGFYFVPGERYRKLSGAYGYPKLKLRLQIEYRDGTVQDVVSNEAWKAAPGPITFSSIYGGEDYNANLEQREWNTAGFVDGAWQNAVAVNGPSKLYHQVQPPLKVHETFLPVRQTKIKDGVYVFDLGQNASGIPQIQVRGRRGDTVRIVPGELLKEDGTVSQRATGSPVYFQYVLKGDGTEIWQPRFSYYGFRYLQAEGCAVKGEAGTSRPVLLNVKGLHTRSAAPTTGSFVSSSTLFNRIHSLIDWAVRSNMASVLTDCPHREKLGWLEQVHLMGNSIQYRYNVANYFRKTLADLHTAQGDSFHLPEYVPEFVKMPFMDGIFTDSPEWGSTAIILPWYLYQWYGDKKVLTENYGLMQRYLKHLQAKAKDNVLAYGLSDWYDLGPNRPGLAQLTPMGLTATAVYYYDLSVLTKAATLLNKKADALFYDSLAAQVYTAFNKTFFKRDSLYYGTNSQTANAMALYMKLAPDEYRQAVLDNLIKDIRSRDNAITAGDIGFRYLLKVLQEEGRSDVIFDMNSRSDVPGYGYQLVKGATALTESWQASPLVSNNHLMLGHLMEWFYSGPAGIRLEDGVAYKSFVVHPQPVGNLTAAKASIETAYGTVVSDWKKTADVFQLAVTVPPNTEARVVLPASSAGKIFEGGRSVQNRDDVKLIADENGVVNLQVGSGTYRFEVRESNHKSTAAN